MEGNDGIRTTKVRGKMSEADRTRKAELRGEIRARLKAMSPEERVACSADIRRRLVEQAVWKSSNAILAFVPTAHEPDIWPAVIEALASGRQLALLRYSPDGDRYVPCLIRDPARDLRPGQHGILEPGPQCPIFDLMRLDLALVPGIGFTLDGGRLGRGKGYYDRLLAEVPVMKCGVAFDCQIASEFPLEPHDVQLNCILTPTRWHLVGGCARS
jgi:5-formyltetrahydrofolate cyclo-ligase